jgi:LPS-assembly lipoprotein
MSWSRAGLFPITWLRPGLGAVLLAVMLAGCGFRPLYADRQAHDLGAASELAKIQVAPISDRLGQLVRNHLIDQLTPLGKASAWRYRLTVVLTPSQEGVALAQDQAATRYNFQLRSKFILAELSSGAEILSGSARSIAVYNVVSADFSTLTAEADARRRAAREISDEITIRLAVFFTRRSSAR